MLKSVEAEPTEGEPGTVRQAPAPVAIILALATVYVVWGSTYLAMRVAVQTLPPFLMAGTRFVVAGLIAYAWARSRGASRPSRRDIIDAFVAGGLLLLGGNGSVVWAVQTMPTGVTALIVAVVPLWIALLDWLRPGGSRPDVRTCLSLFLGMAGVAWLIVPKTNAGAGVPVGASVVLVLGSLAWSVGSLYMRARAASHSEPFLKTAALQMLAGGSLLLLTGLAAGEVGSLDPTRFSGQSLAAMAYLIVAGSLGYTAYGWLLTVVRPTLAATYAFVNPVIAVMLGCVVAGEELSVDTLLAGGVVVVAVAFMVMRPKSPGPAEQ